MKHNNPPLTYKEAGVDIDAGDALVDHIKPLARSTDRAGVLGGLGGFGGLFDLKAAGFKDPILVSGTDGVGTKLRLAIDAGIPDTVGIDLVAMCVNDIVVQGAEPLFFLDYYATGRLEVEAGRRIVAGIAEGCRRAGCALIGGETAEMPGMYAAGDYDLAGFAVGAAERDQLLPRDDIAAGDVVLGLASSGLHSNGFSLVRHVLLKSAGWSLDRHVDEVGRSLGEELLEPTRIYAKACLALAAETDTHAMSHITGGGLAANLARVMPEELSATVERPTWTPQPVFDLVRRVGDVPQADLEQTLNCGVGMVALTGAEDADKAIAVLARFGVRAWVAGAVSTGDGSVDLVGQHPGW